MNGSWVEIVGAKPRTTTAFIAVLFAAAWMAAPAAAGDFVGVYADDAFFGSAGYRSIAFAAQADTGVEVVRQPFDWRRIETSPGQYDFTQYDDFVLAAAAAGLHVLPVLGNPPSFRARSITRDDSWSPPRSNAEFAAFAARLVERYGPGGTLWTSHLSLVPMPIHSWQIWNEPNLAMFWNTGPDAAEYTALLEATYPAIHGVDAGAEVVAAGIPDSRLGVPLENYLGWMFASGARGAFDTMALHAYAPTPGDAVNLVVAVRSLLTAYGDSSPLWVTEAGWATGGPFSPFTVSEADQAAYIGEIVRRLVARRNALGVRGVVVFRWRDAVAPYDAWPLHAGLLRADGSAKPSLAALRDAAAAIPPEPPAGEQPGVAETLAESGAAPRGSATGAPGTVAGQVRAKVAIGSGRLSRFGFLRVHLQCLGAPCSVHLRAGRAGTACSGARTFNLSAREAAVVRVSLRRARRGVTRCRRMLVTANTGPTDPPAAAFIPKKGDTVTLRP